jgi:competence protein ComEA
MPTFNRVEQRAVLVLLICGLAVSAVQLFSSAEPRVPRRRLAAGAAAASVAAAIATTSRPDPNEATADELQRVPGITPALAQAIVRYRRDHVLLAPSDLHGVAGLEAAELSRFTTGLSFPEKPQPGKVFTGPRLDLNRASLAELERVPGLGTSLAREIVERRARQPFTDLEELLAVPSIGPGKLTGLQQFLTVRPAGEGSDG